MTDTFFCKFMLGSISANLMFNTSIVVVYFIICY